MEKNELIIRPLEIKDLADYLKWQHPSRAFHRYNGPYYKKKNEEELHSYVAELERRLLAGEKDVLYQQRMIAEKKTDTLIGQVNWYWKSEETLWMEVGIVIFNEAYWGRGIGEKALSMWIDQCFGEWPNLVRIGLSTWSGNHRMMHLAEKLGLQKEAVYRQARIVEGVYYDALSYGILKSEWLERRSRESIRVE